jgi:hypothetical protein
MAVPKFRREIVREPIIKSRRSNECLPANLFLNIMSAVPAINHATRNLTARGVDLIKAITDSKDYTGNIK